MSVDDDIINVVNEVEYLTPNVCRAIAVVYLDKDGMPVFLKAGTIQDRVYCLGFLTGSIDKTLREIGNN